MVSLLKDEESETQATYPLPQQSQAMEGHIHRIHRTPTGNPCSFCVLASAIQGIHVLSFATIKYSMNNKSNKCILKLSEKGQKAKYNCILGISLGAKKLINCTVLKIANPLYAFFIYINTSEECLEDFD